MDWRLWQCGISIQGESGVMPMNMTRERLEQYRSNVEEIKELTFKLEHLGEGDGLIGNDVVFDYRTGYPKPQSVVGYDYDLEQSRRERWVGLIEKLQAECKEVEQWIDTIPNSLMRRVLRMSFIDGLPQQKIAKRVHLSQSAISKKIDVFLKME